MVSTRILTDAHIERLRVIFERNNRDSYNFARSRRRGVYVNPAISRDWRWFLLGAASAEK